MIDVSANHGTFLPPCSSALVVSAEGELSFYLPDNPPDTPVPRLVQLLVAVLMRSKDEEPPQGEGPNDADHREYRIHRQVLRQRGM